MPGGKARRLATAAVFAMDRLLRRWQGIYEFASAEECTFRIAIVRSDDALTLADGTEVRRGEPIVELHFWNEHTIPFAGTEPDLVWARNVYGRWLRSLKVLAEHVRTAEPLRNVQAMRATLLVADAAQRAVWSRFLQRHGFQIVELPRRSIWGWLHQWGEDLLLWALTWASNPASLRGKGFHRQRLRCWMPRQVLLQRYLPSGQTAASGQVSKQPL